MQTLGHLEKAVVLELTLKHLKALTALTEQQHQKIIALQNGKSVQGGQATPDEAGQPTEEQLLGLLPHPHLLPRAHDSLSFVKWLRLSLHWKVPIS